MNFYENSYFYHFSMPGGPGTRPEALGTPGIDSTSIKKMFFLILLIFFISFISILLINVPWIA